MIRGSRVCSSYHQDYTFIHRKVQLHQAFMFWDQAFKFRNQGFKSRNQAFISRNQASGTTTCLGTKLSYLGTRLPVTGHFLERKDGGRIVSSLSDASQQFEEKYSEPSHKEANSAIFSTSAVISSKPDPYRQDQPLLTLFYLGFFAKIAKFLF